MLIMKFIWINNMKNPHVHISREYHKLVNIALEYIKYEAKRILLEHPELDEFVMGMGTYFFTDKNKNTISLEDLRYANNLNLFINKWDEYLKLSGVPMRFTATSPVVIIW